MQPNEAERIKMKESDSNGKKITEITSSQNLKASRFSSHVFLMLCVIIHFKSPKSVMISKPSV